MRILHVITALPGAGAEMMLLRLLSAMQEGYSHTVICLKDEGVVGPKIRELGVPLYTLNLRPSLPNPVHVWSLRTLTRQIQPQLIQGWMYHGNVMASLAGKFARDRVPVVWNVRQSLTDPGAYGRRTSAVIRLGALLSGRPVAIIYNSLAGAQDHERFGYRADQRVVIPNGFDCQLLRPDENARSQVRAELRLAPETILVGLIARYHPMKDHANFLRAAGQVVRDYPTIRFLLVGHGVSNDQPSIVKLITENQLAGRVMLLGGRQDIPRLTAALDIACSASAWGEGFSNAIAEAMACGVPCVVTDVGDSATIVADTGIPVPPRNPGALAQAINQLIEAGKDRRLELGMAARRRIEREFSLAEIARRYEELYRRLLAHQN